MAQIKMFIWHCRRMLGIASLLSGLGYWLSPDSETGRFWVASLWMFMTPLILMARYDSRKSVGLTTFILRSPRRSRMHILESALCVVLALLVGICASKELSLAAVSIGIWGAFLCAVSSILDQMGRRSVDVLSIVTMLGLAVWSSPFWLGAWLGEPGFTPWLASWIMWLHPVSQALTFSGLSNLIEPVFYSLTFIGVVEVELFKPLWGLLLASLTTVGMFGYSYFLNRRRSAIASATLD